MGEGHELPGGAGVAEMQSGAFLRHILRNVTVCALTSSLLDDSSNTVSWEAGHFWGGSFYPSNTLDRTLTDSRYYEDGRSCFL